MMKEKYKYEVAFSFLKQDEAIAYDLNDRIQDRLSTFIYSKKQEELGGTDGEIQFNNVFNKEARVVVVLYRNGWGQTSWTRIEETAIKNRAFDKGWNFLFIINLDVNSTLPSWIPKTNIWLDYQRFKSEGAIAVIDQKVHEAGGHIRPETIEEKAEKLKRHRNAEIEREQFLINDIAVSTAYEEVASIIDKLKRLKPLIEDPTSHLLLGMSERTANPKMYEFGYQGFFLCFNNSELFDRKIIGGRSQLFGVLKVTIYERRGHIGFNYEESVHQQVDLQFDRDLLGKNGWSEAETGKNFVTSEELVDNWVKQFLEGIGKRKNRS